MAKQTYGPSIQIYVGSEAVGDPNVKVELADSNDPWDIKITFYHVVFYLHAVSAIDLQAKLNMAISNWIATTAFNAQENVGGL